MKIAKVFPRKTKATPDDYEPLILASRMLQLEQCMQSQFIYVNFGGDSGYIGNGGSGRCTTFNALDSRMNEYPSKKESWIEKMDKLIFPNDSIRDGVENEVERISRKYTWIDEI